jgi:flagellar biogenesis protein FliO
MESLYLWAVATPNPEMGGWFDYAKTLLVLIGICLLAMVAVKILIPRLSGLPVTSSGNIRVFARYPLEPRKTLYLVKAGKTMVLLASSGDAIQFMTALDANDFEENEPPTQRNSEGSSAFSRIARAIADRQSGKHL